MLRLVHLAFFVPLPALGTTDTGKDESQKLPFMIRRLITTGEQDVNSEGVISPAKERVSAANEGAVRELSHGYELFGVFFPSCST